ncbi:MAG: CinA family protein [Magnetococcales bacterium]|nr:CinA family protein [Magnetococcales bacterium]
MKSLIVIQRWSETEAQNPASGRPYIDLVLNCLGFAEINVVELIPGERFDLEMVDDDVRLVLVQGQRSSYHSNSNRLRRSLLSSLGLSLGLEAEGSDRLRVVGAKPLHDKDENVAGFAIKRQGRIVAYFEESIWALHKDFTKVMNSFLSEERSSRRIRFNECWLVEGAGHSLELAKFLEDEEIAQCQVKYLPSGDAAILLPKFMGDDFKNRLKENLKNRLYAKKPQPLEVGLVDLFAEHKATVSTAESCTSGLISSRLASTPGSSNYLQSGFVTYSRKAKIDSLGVSEVLLKKFGEVSREVAIAMARGAQRTSGSTLAVSATGIAGPGGGSDKKPVGTVFLAAVSSDGEAIEHKALFKGSRDRVRFQASQTALHLLRRMLNR